MSRGWVFPKRDDPIWKLAASEVSGGVGFIAWCSQYSASRTFDRDENEGRKLGFLKIYIRHTNKTTSSLMEWSWEMTRWKIVTLSLQILKKLFVSLSCLHRPCISRRSLRSRMQDISPTTSLPWQWTDHLIYFLCVDKRWEETHSFASLSTSRGFKRSKGLNHSRRRAIRRIL